MTMLRAVSSVIVLAAWLAACGGTTGAAAPTPVQTPSVTNQSWVFASGGGNATGLMRSGASLSPDDMCCWRSNFNGCIVDTRFAVQFSSTSVRLLSFRINGSTTTCQGVTIAESGGTGTANASFGSATTASGTSTLIFRTPLGQGGGTANWNARRLN